MTATATPEIGVSLATMAPPTAILIQTTPTPLPTVTATPFPTPIVYIIVEGDTLLAIALDRGNTVDEIKALNPDIRPELLQLGQQIILPPPATPLAQVAASTAVPLQINVVQIETYQTPVGSLWLLGEVVNAATYPARNVGVEISLMDEGGNLLNTAVAWVIPSIIPAGEAASFAVLINEPPTEFTYPVVTVMSGETAVDLGATYLNLTGQAEIVSAGEEGSIKIEGVVQNVGAATAVQPDMVLILYDNQGKITGLHQVTLDNPLKPGEDYLFTATVAPPGGQTAVVKLLIQALRGEE